MRTTQINIISRYEDNKINLYLRNYSGKDILIPDKYREIVFESLWKEAMKLKKWPTNFSLGRLPDNVIVDIFDASSKEEEGE